MVKFIITNSVFSDIGLFSLYMFLLEYALVCLLVSRNLWIASKVVEFIGRTWFIVFACHPNICRFYSDVTFLILDNLYRIRFLFGMTVLLPERFNISCSSGLFLVLFQSSISKKVLICFCWVQNSRLHIFPHLSTLKHLLYCLLPEKFSDEKPITLIYLCATVHKLSVFSVAFNIFFLSLTLTNFIMCFSIYTWASLSFFEPWFYSFLQI